MEEKEKAELIEWLDRCAEVIKSLNRFPASSTGAHLSLPSNQANDAYLMHDCWKVAIPLGLHSEIKKVDSKYGFEAAYFIEHGGIKFYSYMSKEELEDAKKLEEKYEV